MAVIIFGGVIAVAIFVVDLNLGFEVAGGVPYILPVLVLTFCSEHRYILVMAAICSATGSLESRAPYQVTHRLRMPDGRIKWVEENCESEFDVFGNPLISRGTVQDITALARAEEALRESEARYRSLIENSDLGIHVGSLTKGRLFVNRACADLFGYDSPEELIAAPRMALIPDHEADRIDKLRQNVFAGRASESSYEYDAQRKDGSIIPLQVFMQRITWEGEEALLRTFVDLSDRKRAEEQLQQSQKMEAVGQLTGGIAHEFNNLLMVIVGNLDLTMGRVTDDKARKFMSFAMDSAMRGADLTSKLLSFSRKQTLRAEDLDLNGVVSGMREPGPRPCCCCSRSARMRSSCVPPPVAAPMVAKG